MRWVAQGEFAALARSTSQETIYLFGGCGSCICGLKGCCSKQQSVHICSDMPGSGRANMADTVPRDGIFGRGTTNHPVSKNSDNSMHECMNKYMYE